jgi:hypothetical protein
MAAKKVTLQVIADAVQLDDGRSFYNGQQFTVNEAQAKKLLATGKVMGAVKV